MKQRVLAWMLVTACGLLPVAGAAAAARGVVSGTATFRERIALPPGAVFEATLEDVSRADAPAERVSAFRKEDAGSPPYRFELAYDPTTIIPSRTYAVRARVTLSGRLLFTTDEFHPVITRGSPTTVDMVMKRVAGAAARSSRDRAFRPESRRLVDRVSRSARAGAARWQAVRVRRRSHRFLYRFLRPRLPVHDDYPVPLRSPRNGFQDFVGGASRRAARRDTTGGL